MLRASSREHCHSGQACSAARLAFGTPGGSVNELPVVHNAKDLDDIVWSDPIKQQMARISNAMLPDDQAPRGPEMQCSDVLGAGNGPGTGHGRGLSSGSDRSKDQSVVASCRFDAPALRALKYDLVDPAFCASGEAPGHQPLWVASRSRTRAMTSASLAAKSSRVTMLV